MTSPSVLVPPCMAQSLLFTPQYLLQLIFSTYKMVQESVHLSVYSSGSVSSGYWMGAV